MKPSARLLLHLSLLLAAVGLAVFPPGPALVERWYADGVYPSLQTSLTAASSRTRIAVFDVALGGAVVAGMLAWGVAIHRARKKRRLGPLGTAVVNTATSGAIVYLWFLGAWGLNYARPPLESVLAYDTARISPQAVRALAELAVDQANRTHAAAHAAGFPRVGESPAALAAALHAVEREMGRPRPTLLARPKTSILSPYFRAAGVSGMVAPFFLETLINPDLTGPERPFVLAHEWAHLSGYAPESDASFVGLLATLRADPASQYSGWLELVSESVNQLQPITQRLVLESLGPGPRADQQAIRERLRALVAPVERVAWTTYDRMLKSQGVDEGVRSYSRVVQLLIATGALDTLPKP